MFVIKDIENGDYLAEYTLCAGFTPNIVNCFQYKTYKEAASDLHYYQLEDTCEIVEIKLVEKII
jgi:hypothetical protein